MECSKVHPVGAAVMLTYAVIAAAAAQAQAQATPAVAPPSDDIVVTGERVPRTLRQTPSSVHVVTAPEIEARPVWLVEELLASVPNVVLGNGSQGPVIRGQDSTGPLQALPAFLGGNRPRTTIVVDGRALNYNEFVFGAASLWDVERVEVFRSPQTTTQGQNSIAGAIFVHTAEPADEPEYRFRAIASSRKGRQVSTVASAPLGRGIAARIAGDFAYNRTSVIVADRVEGGDPNHEAYGLLRLKLKAEPSWIAGTTLGLTYVHQQSQAPQVVSAGLPFRDRRNANPGYGVFRLDSDWVSFKARHERGQLTADLTLVAGDTLAERLAPRGFGQARNAGRDWSGEAVVNWSGSDAVEITAGASRRHNRLKQRIDLSVLSGIPTFRDWQDGTGLFGEARLRLAPRLTVAGGLRYQQDRQKRLGSLQSDRAVVDLDYDRTFSALLPKLSVTFEASPDLTAGMLVQKAYNPGGTTLRFDTGEPDMFEAERLWAFEAFARTSLAGGRLGLSANLFRYDISDAQRSKDIRIRAPNGLFATFADLFNVPKAKAEGAEVEIQWRPGPKLSTRAAIGLLRTRIIDAGTSHGEIEGNSFERSPGLTGSAAVDWRPSSRIRLSGQIRHHGPYYSDPFENPATRVTSGTIADAKGEFRAGPMILIAYARNLFDTFSVVSRTETAATLEEPREVGFGIETRF